MFESLTVSDPQIASLILQEERRQQEQIELIASENIVSSRFGGFRDSSDEQICQRVSGATILRWL